MDFKIHYFPKKIKELKDSDEKVTLMGKILSSSQNSFHLKDDTGSLEIFTDKRVEQNKTVKVFCSLVDGELKMDFLQDMEGADLNLFKRVEELYKRVGI